MRACIALVVAFDLVSFVVFIGDARERALLAAVEADAATWFVSALPVRVALAACGIVAIAVFARRPGHLASGGVALGVLALLSHSHAALFGSPWRHLYYSGLALLGWLGGSAFSRWRGAARDESYAQAGATALLGAAYFSAGLSKLVYGGPAWVAGATLRYAVLAQSGLVGDGPLDAARRLVVDDARVAAALAIGTLVFELGGALFVFGARLRTIVALGLISMHVTIFLLTGISYVESVVLLAVFGLPLVPVTSPPSIEGPSARQTAAAVALLAVITSAAVFREARDDGPSDGVGAVSSEADRSSVPRLESVGPFTIGDTLGDHELVGLRTDAHAVTLVVERDHAQVTFDLVCGPSPHRGPFDREPVHLFHRVTSVPLSDFEPAANAILDRVAPQGTDAGDPCGAVTAWLEQASPSPALP